MLIEINELECKRFGIISGRLTDPGATAEAIQTAANTAGLSMLTARVDVAELSTVHRLEAMGFQLMDTLVFYTRALSDAAPAAPKAGSGIEMREANATDSGAVSLLARAAFREYIGHYHADPRLDNADADAAYIEWAQTSTANCSEEAPVVLAEDATGLLGFATLRRNDDEEHEIVLSAVHPEAQGKGVYSRLIREGLTLSAKRGAGRVVVSTQINNYAVQRVWARLGFCHTRSLYTFHKWFSVK